MNPMDVVIQPCKGIEPYTWEWWLKSCWMLPNSVTEATVALAVIGVTGAAVWMLIRRRG